MSEVAGPVPAPVLDPLPVPRRTRSGSGAWVWGLAIAVIAAAGALVALRLAALERELHNVQRHGEEIAAQHTSDVTAQQGLQERLDATMQRTEQLEQQLTLLAGRDTAADAELRRLREQYVLAEVDELLTLAGSQLQLVRDPNAAITALVSADARLARVPRPQFFALREALARDIDRLRKTPVVDIPGTAIRLDQLAHDVDTWHLLADPTRRLATTAPKPHPDSNGTPSRFGWIGHELSNAFGDLVQIRTAEAPDSLLLPADQYPLVREHLRVRLLMVRQAMLMRNQTLFRADLGDSLAIINRYFDPSDPLVARAITTIKALQAAAIDVPMPTLDDSLAALRAARPATTP
ncbi:MAG TPA: uroporphyrinogen-III C-methyltransferase [Burkholderiaceae bacterium]